MKFIEALKLKSKLFFLFFLITLGLVIIGIMGRSYVNDMKKNIDALYFGSLVPVTELNSILNTYHGTLFLTLHKAKRGVISKSEVFETIQTSLDEINKKWQRYKSHYKTEEEMQYIDYADMEIQRTNHYFQKVMDLVYNGKDLQHLSIKTLEKTVFDIQLVLQKLLRYEINVAHYERQKFLYTYKDIMKQIGFILTFVIVGVLAVLWYVFESIQNDHSRLEKTARKLKIANKKLENVSYTDTLTNLHNRRYFNFIFDREVKRAKRSRTYISFMMVDIDFFKQYNDTYGHIEGDMALKKVAKVLRASFKRPSDYVFRLGGEEFGILLSDTDASNTARLARELTENIKEVKIPHENSLVCEYLTLSIGVVCCIADSALDEEVIISRADEMLYKAKETGRDRYVITTDLSKNEILMEECATQEQIA